MRMMKSQRRWQRRSQACRESTTTVCRSSSTRKRERESMGFGGGFLFCFFFASSGCSSFPNNKRDMHSMAGRLTDVSRS